MRLKNNHLGHLKAVSMMNGILLFALLLVIPSVTAQEQEESNFNEYKGVVVDAKTKKVLEFATVSISNSNISTISNTDGVFLLKVPMDLIKEKVIISYLGYANKSIPLSNFTEENMMINMEESFEKLPDVNIVEADPVKVIRKVLENRRSNIYLDPLIVKAFYRESIKKRKTYASLSEAVIDIYKQPFASSEGDYVKLDRARKSTDYRKIDTLVIKLQGGPYNNLSMDMIRNEDLFFSADMYEIYKFF
jgi:uncharacterized protein YpiB (UPF0302 family)